MKKCCQLFIGAAFFLFCLSKTFENKGLKA